MAQDSDTPSTGKRRASGGWLQRGGIVLGVAFVLAAGWDALVFVDETEHVVVERFGRIAAVYDRADDRGLHFKWPRPVDVVRRFDRRVQLLDPPAREVFTRDRKNITVDVYVCWRIADPDESAGDGASAAGERPVVRFYRGLGTTAAAQALLESRIQSVTASEIARVELGEILAVDDSEAEPDPLATGPLDAIAARIRTEASRRSREDRPLGEGLGIELVDVRIKRVDLPAGNLQAVYDRMRSERRKIADRYRSAGQAESDMIRSQADLQSEELLARARADAERIRGTGEAEATGILNRAQAEDPEFHRTLQQLDAYRRILDERTTLVLSASSRLWRLLSEGVPAANGSEPAAGPPVSPRAESETPAPTGAAP